MSRSQTSHLGTGRMSLLWAGPSLRGRCRSTSKKQRSVRWPLGACDSTHNKAYRHSVITITHTYTCSYTHTSTNAKHIEGWCQQMSDLSLFPVCRKTEQRCSHLPAPFSQSGGCPARVRGSRGASLAEREPSFLLKQKPKACQCHYMQEREDFS